MYSRPFANRKYKAKIHLRYVGKNLYFSGHVTLLYAFHKFSTYQRAGNRSQKTYSTLKSIDSNKTLLIYPPWRRSAYRQLSQMSETDSFERCVWVHSPMV